jgi:hypothetical protein
MDCSTKWPEAYTSPNKGALMVCFKDQNLKHPISSIKTNKQPLTPTMYTETTPTSQQRQKVKGKVFLALNYLSTMP